MDTRLARLASSAMAPIELAMQINKLNGKTNPRAMHWLAVFSFNVNKAFSQSKWFCQVME